MREKLDLFTGKTEVDELFIHGRQKWAHGRLPTGRQAVVAGAVDTDRKKAIFRVIPTNDSYHLMNFLKEHVSRDSVLHTDEWSGYNDARFLGYKHFTVNHSKHFVYKGISTQSAEALWSTLRRGIYGIYHQVSVKWLQNYLAEFEFRYNNREEKDIFGKVVSRV